jgi:hypothetical protein
MKGLNKLLKEAAIDGVIHCPKGHGLEPDAPVCQCGWKNPLVILGMI